MTKLGGNLPKGDGNGLGPIVQQLISTPHQVHVVVALVDCRSTKVDHDTGDLDPTIRVRRIEAVIRDDLSMARKLLDRAYEERCGQAVLPFELEADVRAAFDNVNLQTGEVLDDRDDTGGKP
jgi:hypothetical protein